MSDAIIKNWDLIVCLMVVAVSVFSALHDCQLRGDEWLHCMLEAVSRWARASGSLLREYLPETGISPSGSL